MVALRDPARRVPPEPAAVQRHAVVRIDQAREAFGAFDVARHPVQVIGGAAQASSSFPQRQRAEDPGVLGAAALGGINDQGAIAQRDAGQSAGNDGHVLAGQHEGAQVDVTGREALCGEGGTGGERQRRLRDVVFGGGEDSLAKILDLAPCVAAGPMSMP